MQPIRRILGAAIFLAALAALTASAAEAAVVVRRLEATLEIADQSLLSVDLPIGDVMVSPQPPAAGARRVEVEATVRCSRFNRRCRRQADDLSLRLEARTAGIEVAVGGYARYNLGGLPQVDLVIRLPAEVDLEIDLGVGKVVVEGGAGGAGIDIDLGVGDVELRLALERIASVRLEVGVGAARIEPEGLADRRSGFLVFDNQLDWAAGRGRADVHVEIGVGSAEVILE